MKRKNKRTKGRYRKGEGISSHFAKSSTSLEHFVQAFEPRDQHDRVSLPDLSLIVCIPAIVTVSFPVVLVPVATPSVLAAAMPDTRDELIRGYEVLFERGEQDILDQVGRVRFVRLDLVLVPFRPCVLLLLWGSRRQRSRKESIRCVEVRKFGRERIETLELAFPIDVDSDPQKDFCVCDRESGKSQHEANRRERDGERTHRGAAFQGSARGQAE